MRFLQKFCAFPLCGDQGNALGLYQAYRQNLIWPGHLNWGIRSGDTWQIPAAENFYTFDNIEVVKNFIGEEIKRNGFVNVVRGNMEFGPRALCNTSTLGIPSSKIVARINKANDRNTIMPMAPVMNRITYEGLFRYWHKVHMSEQHMIVALPYTRFVNQFDGVMHEYIDEWTGRPQVISANDDLMQSLLRDHDVLINTSFNVHGWPIVFTREHAIQNHNFQAKYEASVLTVFIRGDESEKLRGGRSRV
jgi:predicted NodU family carbamoyl transferase